MINSITNNWSCVLQKSLNSLDKEYLEFLQNDKSYFPNIDNFLNSFKTLDLNDTKYILFGQDPYPRVESAIGYAFIDGAVSNLWDDKNGLAREVNKATSLRNFIKMLLICDGKLNDCTSKEAVAKIDKSNYIQTIQQLKDNFERNGVLLLNTALIFTTKLDTKYHAKMWLPFTRTLLKEIQNHNIELILFGNLAKNINKLTESKNFMKYHFEHPYNVSFIKNERVHKLFKDMKLLTKQSIF